MIPAVVNRQAGTAAAAERALRGDGRFDVHVLPPGAIPEALEGLARDGARRVLIAGGDGTLSAAARVLLPHGVEMAVLPGGTLNHFARWIGVPTDVPAALDVAAGASARAVDVATVNGIVFLNTSSVGGYVRLVDRRERVEPYLGYHLGGLVAAAALLVRLPGFSVEVEIQGRPRRYRTPLVFVGVGERELKLPRFGERVRHGRSALHTIAVEGKGRARLLAIGLAAAAYGIRRVSRTPHVDSFLVEECRVDMARTVTRVAVDGEILHLETPLRYRLLREALRIAAPAGD